MRLIRAVRDAEQGETSVQPNPEDDITKKLIPLDSRNSTNGNQRYLCQLECKQVHPKTRSVSNTYRPTIEEKKERT